MERLHCFSDRSREMVHCPANKWTDGAHVLSPLQLTLTVHPACMAAELAEVICLRPIWLGMVAYGRLAP